MGKVVTPKYRIEAVDNQGRKSQWCWKGRVSEKALAEYMLGYNKSFLPGGTNEHVGKQEGVVPYHHKAQIVNQFTNEIVATWNAPVFQVL